jgi:hypothetical protein
MSQVPKEIFSLIDAKNVSVFLTCKDFYQFIDIFYRKFEFYFYKSPIALTSAGAIPQPSGGPINDIAGTKSSTSLIPEYCKNIYILVRAPQVPDGAFENIRHISFCQYFNENVDDLAHLPNVESIVFGSKFNQQVDNLPKTLKSLTFSYDFNQRVDNLPERLTSIIFGCGFNQRVDKLPTAREKLNIDKIFLQL